jgi:hypothetical protein
LQGKTQSAEQSLATANSELEKASQSCKALEKQQKQMKTQIKILKVVAVLAVGYSATK